MPRSHVPRTGGESPLPRHQLLTWPWPPGSHPTGDGSPGCPEQPCSDSGVKQLPVPEEQGDRARFLGDPHRAGPGACWQAQTPCSRSLPGRCPSDRGDGSHHSGGGTTSHWEPSRAMALERARGRPGALHSCSHRQRQGALGHPDPVCPDSWEGRCRGLNGCFRDQPGDFPAQHVRQAFPLAEDESPAHVPHARQDARHDRHWVNGRHPAPPASVPLAPTAVHPVRQAVLHCRRQTQVGARGGGWDMPEFGGCGMAQPWAGRGAWGSA